VAAGRSTEGHFQGTDIGWAGRYSPRAVAFVRVPVRGVETRNEVVAVSSGESLLSVADNDARLAEIVHSARDAIVGETLDGTVTVWNRAAEELYGYPAVEMVGQPADRLYPPERCSDEAAILRQVARRRRPGRYLAERVRRDGTRITVSVRAAPIVDSAGLATGVATMSWEADAECDGASDGIVGIDASSRISHELRTSLNAIIGFTGTLLMRLPGPLNDEQEHQLRLVQSSAETVLSRINQISRPRDR
jgi:PAS domain S-box-containing protein